MDIFTELLTNELVQQLIIGLLVMIAGKVAVSFGFELNDRAEESIEKAAKIGFAFAQKKKVKGEVTGADAKEIAIEVAKENLPKIVRLIKPTASKKLGKSIEHVHSVVKLADGLVNVKK